MQAGNIVILVVLVISLAGGNNQVAIASTLVLLINLLRLDGAVFPVLERNGLQVGVIVLTAALLVPLATGRISPVDMLHSLKQVRTILAIVVGVVVAYFAGRGMHLLTVDPKLLSAIITGSIIGVAFLKGVPVGPLIAAGIVAIFQQVFKF